MECENMKEEDGNFVHSYAIRNSNCRKLSSDAVIAPTRRICSTVRFILFKMSSVNGFQSCWFQVESYHLVQKLQRDRILL
jgi:hypothetical protein